MEDEGDPVESSIVTDNLFMILTGASVFGSVAFSMFLTASLLEKPYIPTLVLGLNCIFWFINIKLRLIESPFLLFMIMVIMGGLRQCSYINFLFLANA